MGAPWVPVDTPPSGPVASWTSQVGSGGGWTDPRTILLLTEDGAFLRMENDGFLATETASTISSPWVPL